MSDQSLIQDFADETREHLEELESSLLRLESDSENQELLNNIFRSMHTIKGASEYLGFERIALLSHRLENLLDQFRDGSLTADKVAIDLLIDARDRMGDLIAQIGTSGQETADIEDLLERITAAGSSSAASGSGSAAATAFEGEADEELFTIFVEQLAEGIDQLMETAGRLARQEAVPEAIAEMSDQVEKLSATANYMSYDELTSIYTEMLTGLEAFATISSTADSAAIDTLLQATVAGCIQRIQSLFPNAAALQAIDPTSMSLTADSAANNAQANDSATIAETLDDDAAEERTNAETAFGLEMDAQTEQPADAESETAPILAESDQSLIQDFADETREHLEELESSLLRLESDSENQELLNNIFRSMHTIKGASEYLGFERIALLSHRLENLLDQFRDGSLTADKVAIDLLIDARDRMDDLIAQIGTSGQETADIEDLLERITAAGSSSAASGSGSAAATAFEGEADEELFTIFVEQLAEGIDQLIEIGGHLAHNEDVAESSAKMTDMLDRLSATANYMGYDTLVEIYAAMQADLETFASQLENAGDVEIDAFLQSTVADGLQRIQELFPDAQPLKEIDTGRLRREAMAKDSDSTDDGGPARDGEPSMTGDEAVMASTIAATHSPDVADLLADLPPIDDSDRESLLAKTLDETFLSMHHASEESHDHDHTDPDADPIAMQFSTEMHGADDADQGPRQGGNAPDASSTILDDFGTEQEAAPLVEADPVVPDEPPQTDAAVIDTSDLWPEAPEITPPAPEIASTSTEAPLPRLDLSPPDTEQDEPVEAEPTEEAFTARNSIRKSIRVDAEKVDDLMNQVGELVVNRSSFTQLFHDMRELGYHLSQRFPMQKNDLRMVSDLTTRLSDAATVLGRVSGELQEQVMKVRMLPISRLFNRYPRLVHDLLRDSDKKIQLQFRGEETELDRMVIEQLADPMIHIIRNAVDHGIESQEDRLRKGKPENGILMLEAYHEGSNVIIEVTDDGQGIDLSRIRQKAIEKQLADRETLEQMDEKALIDMIMLPGFSTTDEVTHTSGRGVGMDVVKRNIEKINGTLEIDTRQDVGTRIQIKLPLTLAIIQALMVSCGDSHLTIPMSAVQETLRIDQGEIFTVDGNEVMHLHDEPLPLVRLSELLSMKIPKTSMANQRMFVVVIKTATGRTGFIVDTLLGRQEVVIKPLEDYLQENSGFSGATILGDGAISLILNVDELVVMAKERQIERKLAENLL